MKKESTSSLSSTRDELISREFVSNETRQLVSGSERAVLSLLFRRGSLTQLELSKSLPLSQQSISRVSAKLESRGMVQKGAPVQSGSRGQPSSVLQLNPDYAYSFGISLMADGISVSLSDFTGKTVGLHSPEIADFKRDSVLSSALVAMNRLQVDCSIKREKLFGVGVATTGFRVGSAAAFNTPKTLEGFALIDLEELFSKHLFLPVWAENDGKAATIAELMNGVGRRVDNFAYFYLATGVGGGIVVNGQLLAGKGGNAGEFVGSLPISKYPFPNLELLRTHVNANGQSIDSVYELISNYDDSWPGIDDWIHEAKPSLSLMASATAAILDTDLIVLGGLIPTPLAHRVIPHIEFFDIPRRSTPRDHAKVVAAECPGNATATGASLLPFVDKYF